MIQISSEIYVCEIRGRYNKTNGPLCGVTSGLMKQGKCDDTVQHELLVKYTVLYHINNRLGFTNH